MNRTVDRSSGRRTRSFAAVGLALALLAGPAPGFAQSEADKAAARDLANEGQASLEAGDFTTAVDKFGRADKLFPAPTLKLGLARAQVGAQKLVAGAETYQQIVREGVRPGDPPPFAEAVDSASKELEALKPRIPTIVIVIEGGQNAEITVDGMALPNTSLGVRRIIDPGRHTIRASAAGFAPAEKTIELAEGASETVQLTLTPLAGSPPPMIGPTPQPMDPPPPVGETGDDGGSALTPIGIIALGLGGAGLVVGGITGILAIGKHDDLTSECNSDKECPEDATGLLDNYRAFGTVSTVTFIAGGILAAGGITLLVIGASSGGDQTGSAADPPLVSIHPYVGPNGGGVWGTF